jgi:hypothetical protein
MAENSSSRLRKALIALAFPLLLILPFVISSSWAAPSVAAVSGAVSDGQSLTITGSSFGATGPNIVLFDNFESGTNGINISMNTSTVSHWSYTDYTGTRIPTYSAAFARSGSKSMRTDWTGLSCGDYNGNFVSKTGLNSSYLYFSFWQYIPAGQNIPGWSCAAPANWKLFWFGNCVARYRNAQLCSRSPGVYMDDYLAVIVATNTLPITDCNSGEFASGCGDDPQCPRNDLDTYMCTALARGVWTRFEVYAVASSSSSGSLNMYEANANQSRRSTKSATGKSTQSGEETWNDIAFPGYAYGESTQTYIDDVYIATGPGARARIEIGNNATYSNCTNLAVTTPTVWSDALIVTTVRQGGFRPGDAAYLFVTDANGAVNTQGYPVTISTDDSISPAVPKNLRRIN